MDKNVMLHHLRNPYDVSENAVREARLQAADELERLYAMEERVKKLIDKIEKHETSSVQK